MGSYATKHKDHIMGMRVGSTGSMGASQSSSVSNWQQRQQGIKDLTASLKAGNLGAAQKAFAGLNGSSNANGNSPLAQIGQALQNGDLQGAQQAMQAMQSKHHHHGGQVAPAAVSASTSTAVSDTIGSLISTTA